LCVQGKGVLRFYTNILKRDQLIWDLENQDLGIKNDDCSKIAVPDFVFLKSNIRK